MTVDQDDSTSETGFERSLGETFRTMRLSAGLSIAQVEADLRIKAKYLEAIEDGDAAGLPSRAYTDGFLRNYATYLGLDPAAAVSRFARENGHRPAPSPGVSRNPLPGPDGRTFRDFTAPPPRRGPAASLGRGALALWPLVLFVGLGVAGYAGYGAARDAGLIPPELLAKVGDAPAVSSEDRTGDAVAEADEPTSQIEDAPEPVRVAMIGTETYTGRPDSLGYARAESTPYWRAKPPAVEPIDGPVADIDPENAGVLKADAPKAEPGEAANGWTRKPRALSGDAARIAAEAREALIGSLTASLPKPAASEDDPALTGNDAVASTDRTPGDLTAYLLPSAQTQPSADPGPVEAAALETAAEISRRELTPAEPAQPPRRFALVAKADSWVQITDATGKVAYTGILSPGEAYEIPQREGLKLKTGNAGGLLIELNGQRFGPLGNDGTVMRNVVLNPGAVQASFTLSRAAALSQ